MSSARLMLEMIRFSHTLFALPFALLAAVMAWCAPLPASVSDHGSSPFRWLDLVGILLCMVTARSAAMAFNRLVDRRIDAQNPRTAQRHLVTGDLSVSSVRAFFLVSSLAFIAATGLFLPNGWPLVLAVPVLGFLCGYSYAKRFTAAAHFWLGAALMLAPVCTWIAIRGEFLLSVPGDILPALVIGLAVLLWVGGFDMIYACQDEAFDRQQRLHSVPGRWGTAAALRISAGCHAAMVLLLAALPWAAPQLQLGWIYGCGIAAVAVLLAYEHMLVRPDDLQRVNRAFFQVNAIVSVGWSLVVVVDLLT